MFFLCNYNLFKPFYLQFRCSLLFWYTNNLILLRNQGKGSLQTPTLINLPKHIYLRTKSCGLTNEIQIGEYIEKAMQHI